MPESNWKRIEEAPKGLGPVLLRAGAGPLDGIYIGQQADNGRWLLDDEEVHPLYFCLIPQFDCAVDGAAE